MRYDISRDDKVSVKRQTYVGVGAVSEVRRDAQRGYGNSKRSAEEDRTYRARLRAEERRAEEERAYRAHIRAEEKRAEEERNYRARLRAEERKAEEERIRRDRAKEEYENQRRARAAAARRAQQERELEALREQEKALKAERKAEEKLRRRREADARRRENEEREKKEIAVQKKRLPLGFVVTVLAVTVMVMALIYGMSGVSEVTGEISVMSKKIDELEIRREELTHDIAMKSDASAIEKRAVEEFLMVREGTAKKKYISLASEDKVVLDVNGNAEAEGSGALLSAFTTVFGDLAEYFN